MSSMRTVLSAIPNVFDEITIVGGEPIGWIKVYSCVEAFSSTFTYSNGQSESDFVEYFPNAISVAFLADNQTPADYDFDSPTDSFAVMADVCSNPVIALNNNLDLSWPIDVDTLQNSGVTANTNYINNHWKGTSTALARLVQGDSRCNCAPQNPRAIYDPAAGDGLFMYWACCNHDGVHITRNQCSWDYRTDLAGIEGISLWLGFAANKDKCCDVAEGDGVLSTDCPTIPDPGCAYSLEAYVDMCYCDDSTVSGGSSPLSQPQFFDEIGNDYHYNNYNQNDIDGFVKIALPISVFYVLTAFIIIGVVSLFGCSIFGIHKFIQSKNAGSVQFKKVKNMDTEDEQMCLQ